MAGVKLATAYYELIPSMAGAQGQITSQLVPALGSAGEAGGRSFSSKFSSAVQGIGNVLGGILAYKGIEAVGSAFGAAKDAVFGFNSTLQNSTIAFTTMLGSGQKAQDYLNQLQQFAKSTPFEFQGLVQNAQLMQGMGIAAKDVIPYLTGLGDSVASVGGGADVLNNTILAFSQISAKGTLSMDNMNQLLQGGVPSALKVLAAQFHVSTGQMTNMISSGQVLASDALPKLIDGLEHGTSATAALGGMMDKQSATFTGALSNIGDASTQLLAQAFRPLFDQTSAGLQGLATLLGSPKLTDWATSIASKTQTAISAFHTVVDAGKVLFAGLSGGANTIDFGPATQPVLEFGRNVRDIFTTTLLPAFSTLKDALAGIDFGSVLKGLSPIGTILTNMGPALADFVAAFVSDLAPVLPSLAPVFVSLGKAFADIGSALSGALITALPTVSGVFKDLASAVPPLASALANLPLGGVASALVKLVEPLLKMPPSVIVGIAGAFAVWKGVVAGMSFANVVTGIYQTTAALVANGIARGASIIETGILIGMYTAQAIATGVVTVATTAFGIAMAIATSPITLIVLGIALLIAGIILLVTHWTQITAFLGAVWQVVVTAVMIQLQAFAAFWSAVWNGIVGFFGVVWNGIVTIATVAFGLLVGFVRTNLAAVSAAWSTVWNGVVSFFGGIWNGITGAVSAGIGKVVGFFTGLGGRILGGLGDFGSLLVDVGRNLIDGLLNGIKAVAGRILDAVTAPIKDAIAGAKALLGIHSPSRVFFGIGENTGLGFIGGIGSTVGDAQDAMSSLVAAPSTSAAAAVAASVGAAASSPTSAAAAAPAVFVQNPFTGEYLLATVADVADSSVSSALNTQSRQAALRSMGGTSL